MGSDPLSGNGPPPDREVVSLAEVAAYYERRYRAHGDSALGMDWRDAASQRLRFERLLYPMGTPERVSLLDVGCGNGELLAFLRQRPGAVMYHGIDISVEMVAACRRRFGADSATVASTADLGPLELRADWVVASGTFNVKQGVGEPAWREYLFQSVAQMYAACRVGVAFNIMSTAAEQRYERLFYLDPREAPDLAERCGSPRWSLDHTYPLFEMTITLLR